jgi:hypothetical protein
VIPAVSKESGRLVLPRTSCSVFWYASNRKICLTLLNKHMALPNKLK